MHPRNSPGDLWDRINADASERDDKLCDFVLPSLSLVSAANDNYSDHIKSISQCFFHGSLGSFCLLADIAPFANKKEEEEEGSVAKEKRSGIECINAPWADIYTCLHPQSTHTRTHTENTLHSREKINLKFLVSYCFAVRLPPLRLALTCFFFLLWHFVVKSM